MTDHTAMDVEVCAEKFDALATCVSRIVIGQPDAVRQSFITLLCHGHSLYEGVPGVAKTLLVRTIAAQLGIEFGRIQFTPDLMPSDVIGTPIFQPQDGEFRFRPGPIFTDFLLADEINRAPAKTQAALLEAMQEATATVDGQRHAMTEFFTVFATQNPVEQEGTYPLPEAELDRFLFKIVIPYPDAEAESQILATHHAGEPILREGDVAMSGADIRAARATVAGVVVRDEIFAYAVALIRATRDDASISIGASPRAGLAIVRAAKALAVLEGRDFVLPEDLQAIVLPALRHRIVLEPGAVVDGLSSDEALRQMIRRVPAPH